MQNNQIVVIHLNFYSIQQKVSYVIIEWCPLQDPFNRKNWAKAKEIRSPFSFSRLSFSLMNTFALFCKGVNLWGKELVMNLLMDLKFLKVTHNQPHNFAPSFMEIIQAFYLIPLPLV